MPKIKCICETCNKEYFIQQWYFSNVFRWQTKFCSQECRKKIIPQKKILENNCICKTCGKEFHKKPSIIIINNYCSKECLPKKEDITRYCLTCNKKFKAKLSEVKKGFGIYCSKDCFNKSKHGTVKSICKQCNIEFAHTQTRNATYCSIKCRGIANSKEKSIHWKGGKTSKIMQFRNSTKMINWRKLIFERDNYTCQKCNKKKSGHLQAHHIIPLSTDFSLAFELSNGITLCSDCHYKLHSEIKKKIIRSKQIDIFACC